MDFQGFPMKYDMEYRSNNKAKTKNPVCNGWRYEIVGECGLLPCPLLGTLEQATTPEYPLKPLLAILCVCALHEQGSAHLL